MSRLGEMRSGVGGYPAVALREAVRSDVRDRTAALSREPDTSRDKLIGVTSSVAPGALGVPSAEPTRPSRQDLGQRWDGSGRSRWRSL
jgi:hypothetical protein